MVAAMGTTGAAMEETITAAAAAAGTTKAMVVTTVTSTARMEAEAIRATTGETTTATSAATVATVETIGMAEATTRGMVATKAVDTSVVMADRIVITTAGEMTTVDGVTTVTVEVMAAIDPEAVWIVDWIPMAVALAMERTTMAAAAAVVVDIEGNQETTIGWVTKLSNKEIRFSVHLVNRPAVTNNSRSRKGAAAVTLGVALLLGFTSNYNSSTRE